MSRNTFGLVPKDGSNTHVSVDAVAVRRTLNSSVINDAIIGPTYIYDIFNTSGQTIGNFVFSGTTASISITGQLGNTSSPTPIGTPFATVPGYSADAPLSFNVILIDKNNPSSMTTDEAVLQIDGSLIMKGHILWDIFGIGSKTTPAKPKKGGGSGSKEIKVYSPPYD